MKLNKKSFKRLASILLVAFVGITNVCVLYASDNYTPKEDIEFADSTNSYQELASRSVRSTSGIVPPNGTATFYLNLDSYVGLSKTFLINATSSSTTGVLFVTLTSPRGTIVSNDWIMSVNEVAQWKVTLPSSGTWTVQITSNATSAPVNVFLNWI